MPRTTLPESHSQCSAHDWHTLVSIPRGATSDVPTRARPSGSSSTLAPSITVSMASISPRTPAPSPSPRGTNAFSSKRSQSTPSIRRANVRCTAQQLQWNTTGMMSFDSLPFGRSPFSHDAFRASVRTKAKPAEPSDGLQRASDIPTEFLDERLTCRTWRLTTPPARRPPSRALLTSPESANILRNSGRRSYLATGSTKPRLTPEPSEESAPTEPQIDAAVILSEERLLRQHAGPPLEQTNFPAAPRPPPRQEVMVRPPTPAQRTLRRISRDSADERMSSAQSAVAGLSQGAKDLMEEEARVALRGFYVLEIVLKWIDDNGLDDGS